MSKESPIHQNVSEEQRRSDQLKLEALKATKLRADKLMAEANELIANGLSLQEGAGETDTAYELYKEARDLYLSCIQQENMPSHIYVEDVAFYFDLYAQCGYANEYFSYDFNCLGFAVWSFKVAMNLYERFLEVAENRFNVVALNSVRFSLDACEGKYHAIINADSQIGRRITQQQQLHQRKNESRNGVRESSKRVRFHALEARQSEEVKRSKVDLSAIDPGDPEMLFDIPDHSAQLAKETLRAAEEYIRDVRASLARNNNGFFSGAETSSPSFDSGNSADDVVIMPGSTTHSALLAAETLIVAQAYVELEQVRELTTNADAMAPTEEVSLSAN